MHNLNERCRLCETISIKIKKDVIQRQLYRCPECDYVFVSQAGVLSLKEERGRYEEHQNSINDKEYVAFLSRLLEPLSSFLKYDDLVLDYGSGPEPVFVQMLKQKGFDGYTYDPFFSPEMHEAVYDAVTATETFEHFFNPKDEMDTITSLLSPGGIIGIMTLRYDKDTDFSTWHYTRDRTHIGFFSDKTFRWIEAKYSLELIYDDKERVVIWRKVI